MPKLIAALMEIIGSPVDVAEVRWMIPLAAKAQRPFVPLQSQLLGATTTVA